MADVNRPTPNIWYWPLVLAGTFGLAVLFAEGARAHGGGTNSSGCHTNRSTGDYHCHGSGSSTGGSTYTPSSSWLYGTPAASPSPLRTRCDANGCSMSNIEPIKPAAKPKPKPQAEPPAQLSHQWASEQEPAAAAPTDQPTAATQGTPAAPAADPTLPLGKAAATVLPVRSAAEAAAPLAAPASATSDQEPLASLVALGAGVLAGVVLFRVLRHKRRAAKVLRAARAINQHIERQRDLLFGCTKQVLALTSATARGACLQLEALQLDYCADDRLSTAVIRHKIEIPAALLPLHGGLGRRRGLLKAVPVEHQWFWALEGDTEYHALVVQHHKAWSMLRQMVRVEAELKGQLNRLHFDGRKYLQSEALPRAEETIQEIATHKSQQLEQIRAELPQLETMLSVLTLRIESIEDFGGILLGYERPDDYGNHVIGERELVLIEEVREQCQHLQAQLEAYAELVNLS